MKHIYLCIALSVCLNIATAQQNTWKPGKINTQTRWAQSVNPANALPEYPRPQLARKDWKNLNGLWDYSIIDSSASVPATYQGKILVPYCVESSLSGVQKAVKPNQKLWYRKTFTIPENWQGKDLLLHFDAVDWQTTVWINGKQAGVHTGGSDPFVFNITPYLKKGSQQEIVVAVWDPTDTGMQPRGKQVLDPKGIWYTAVTGIWQTVWLEPVNKTHIVTINPEADIDHHQVTIKNVVAGATANQQLQVKILVRGKVIAQKTGTANQPVLINIPNQQLWSPANPFLYKLDVQLLRNGKVTDKVASYFAMRKVSVAKDALGFERIMLNNQFLFQYGTLDQGWWPESLLTPPTYQAMQYDIDMLKKMGFNMLRKHIKVEPSRYYHYADSVGFLIWQDMPSGFQMSQMDTQYIKPGMADDWNRPQESVKDWEQEWKSIMDHLRFFPSIVTWVPFNEGWGQFETKRIVDWTKQYDPTRIINGVSGWEDRGVGDLFDAHVYPGPGMPSAEKYPGRAIVLGEFGGLGLPVLEHLWNPALKNWGYRTFKTNDELFNAYADLINNLYPMINRGLSAAIYTQTADVEIEVNGLMSYDRKVNKVGINRVNAVNRKLFYKPTGSKVIFADSEVSPQMLFKVDAMVDKVANKTKSMAVKGPYMMAKNESAIFAKEFSLSTLPKHIQLSYLAHGDIEIYLNNKLIVSKFVDSERQPDGMNLSSFINLLKIGKNELLFVVKKATKRGNFDMGLYSF